MPHNGQIPPGSLIRPEGKVGSRLDTNNLERRPIPEELFEEAQEPPREPIGWAAALFYLSLFPLAIMLWITAIYWFVDISINWEVVMDFLKVPEAHPIRGWVFYAFSIRSE